MNIFVLDLDPKKCAMYHGDKHVVKMIVESCQLLCNTHHVLNNKNIPYRKTHMNHPCTIWVSKSLSNYNWLLDLTKELLDEYTYRYGKRHKSTDVYLWLKENKPKISDFGLTDFVTVMKDEFKKYNPIESYRHLYLTEKQHIMKYTKREIPIWSIKK